MERKEIQKFDGNGALLVNSSGITAGNGVNSDLIKNVWGIGKVSEDLSLFHGLWTYNIPQMTWNIYEDGIKIPDNDNSAKIMSEDGGMTINSGIGIGETSILKSRRKPRYQPNRGHYYATAGYLPNITATGIRQWGLKSGVSGVYFELENGILYAVMVNNGYTKKEEITVPADVDLEGGNLFDIQFQWRGVGDYYFYINLKLVHVIRNLGTGTNVTITNPIMPIYYYAENTDGTDVQMRFGCVDVTSEGGHSQGATYISCSNELTLADPQGRNIDGYNQPLIIMRMKDIFYLKENTRNSIFYRMSASSDQKSIMKAFYTDDITAFGGTEFLETNFQTAFPGSSIEYIDCVPYSDTEITFDKTKAIKVLGGRVRIDDTLIVENPSDNVEFFLEGGEYLVLTGEREGGGTCNMFGNIEFGEEI